jgi:penicillin-binding protein 1C
MAALALLMVLPLLFVWLAGRVVAPPAFAELRAGWIPSAAYLLDRHGEVLQTRRMDRSIRRLEWVPLSDVSPALPRAILLAEDRRFYTHGGIDIRALFGAVSGWMGEGRLRGASTLTMQTAGLIDPALNADRTGRSLGRKLRQAALALAIERQWTKAQILEAYLNQAGFRGELQGLAATSQALFGKHPSGLNEAESITLAALLPAPNAGMGRWRRRACAIARSGDFHVSCQALEGLIAGLPAQPGAKLEVEHRLATHLARRFLNQPGERITTTLESRWQRLAQRALDEQLAGLNGRNVRDGAAIIADNSSGEVLAYVGSAGRDSTAREVDGAAARRQAGSTLKPFLYALALERRYLTPASILDDSPVSLTTASGLYIPQNYDREFKGLVSVRTALAASLNVPAVRTMILTGVEPLRDRLADLGYAGITESGEFYGFSLALGSAEVSLLEQVNAYRTLANGGLWSPLRFRTEAAVPPARRVMSTAAAFLVADILSDGASRSVTFGLDSPLATRFWTAVKTGTSKDMRDNWCIGFSRRHTVGVWVGNFEGDAMREVSGVTGAAPAWAAIMAGLADGAPDSGPAAPVGLTRRAVRFEPPVEPGREEWFLAGTDTAVVQAGAGRERPRIESPPGGVIMALDPDIPSARQRLWFKAEGAGQADFWLDGRGLGPASQPVPWLPLPGNHSLQLRRRSDGAVLDRISFQVRAPRP